MPFGGGADLRRDLGMLFKSAPIDLRSGASGLRFVSHQPLFPPEFPPNIRDHRPDFLDRFLQAVSADAKELAPVAQLIVLVDIDPISIRLSYLLGIVCHGTSSGYS
jgi:hypothetical protein